MERGEEHITADTVETYTLRATRIEIVNKYGEPRMKLYAAEDGTPVISLLDKDQRNKLLLTLSDESNGWISWQNGNGDDRIAIGLKEDSGEPTVGLFDNNNVRRMLIYIDNSLPHVAFLDQNDKARLSVFVEENGRPYIMFHDRSEQGQAFVTVPEDGSNSITLEGKDDVAVTIPLDEAREI